MWGLSYKCSISGSLSKTSLREEIGNFVLRVGATTIIEQIEPFHVYLCFFPTRSILDFMQRANLEELETMELVVIGIYGRFAKAFYLGSGKWVG
jgi:hypothetical protein